MINTQQSNGTTWYGLGDRACFGSTCQFGEFCSKDLLYRTCRNCTDIGLWCGINKTHVKLVFPSCFYLCEEYDKQTVATELLESLQKCREEVPTWPKDVVYSCIIAILLMVIVLMNFWRGVKLLRSLRMKVRRVLEGLLRPMNAVRNRPLLMHEPPAGVPGNVVSYTQCPAEPDWPEDQHSQPTAPTATDNLPISTNTSTIDDDPNATPSENNMVGAFESVENDLPGTGVQDFGYSSVQPLIKRAVMEETKVKCCQVAMGDNTFHNDVSVFSDVISEN